MFYMKTWEYSKIYPPIILKKGGIDFEGTEGYTLKNEN